MLVVGPMRLMTKVNTGNLEAERTATRPPSLPPITPIRSASVPGSSARVSAAMPQYARGGAEKI